MKSLLARLTRRASHEGDEELVGHEAIAIPERGLTIFRVSGVAFALMLVVLIGLAGAVFQYVLTKVTEYEQQAAAAQAARVAAQISGTINAYGAIIDGFAHSPAVATALGAGDGAAIAEQAVAFERRLPGALKVRIVPAGYEQIDSSSHPSLGFACLDIAKRAGRLIPPAEVHSMGGKDQHLDVARGVPGASGTLGSVVVALDPELIKVWVQGLLPSRAYLELRQGSGAGAVVLAQLGETSNRDSALAADAPVAGTMWTVKITQPASDVIGSLGNHSGLLLLFLGASTLVALVFFAYVFVLRRLVSQDLFMLVTHVEEMLNMKREYGYKARLLEFKRALATLDEQISLRQTWGPGGHKYDHTAPNTTGTVLVEELDLSLSGHEILEKKEK